MTIGEKICQLRQSKLMTQKELADKLHVSDKVISRWERGVSLPDVEMMKKISFILEVSISELYDYINVETDSSKDNPLSLSFVFIRNNIIAYFLLISIPLLLLIMMALGREYGKQRSILEIISVIITIISYLSAIFIEVLSCFKFCYLTKIKEDKYKTLFVKHLIVFIVLFIVSVILYILVGTEIISLG